MYMGRVIESVFLAFVYGRKLKKEKKVADVGNKRSDAVLRMEQKVADVGNKRSGAVLRMEQKVASVELRMTLRGRQKYLSTGVRCLPSEWNGERVRGRADAAEMNAVLEEVMRRARSAEGILRLRGGLSLEGMVSLMKNDDGVNEVGFWKFCEERIEVRSHGRGRFTGIRYRKLLSFLREHFSFYVASDVRESDVVRLDRLLEAGGVSERTRWYNYHRYFKALLGDAVKEGLCRRNVYDGGCVVRPKDDESALERCLTVDEFERLRSLELPEGFLSRVRDLFVFQCYTCLSYVDLAGFDAGLVQDVDGRMVYSSRRHKTGERFTVLLMSEAVSLLERYEWRLPVISNQKYNVYLKEVARRSGITKPISSHWARHTGATILLNAGVPMDVVARVLGHSSSEVTRKVYAKLLDETVAREMMRVEDIFGKNK